MSTPFRNKMMKIIITAVTIYLILLLLVFIFQRKVIYYPYKLDNNFAFPNYVPALEEVFITCEDGLTINGLFAPGDKNKPVIMIFHGNAGDMTHRDFLLRGFNNELSHTVLIIDYHGYGKSEGAPTEKNLYLDGDAALKWLGEEKDIRPGEVVLFGKSLGSGVAVELATKNIFRGVILETPFASIASAARYLFPYNCFPISLLAIDKYDNLSKIKNIHAPLLLVHGTQDTIVNKKESEKLFKKAHMPKELYLVEGADHNDIQFIQPQKYWDKISEWIAGLK
jgi:fermentation-respiration switch protein FrsA (DUF1100 family)